MKDVLLRVIGNSAVRKALITFVLAVLTAAGISLGTGCAGATPSPAEVKAQLECRLAALKTVVPRSTALELVEAAQAGKWDRVAERLVGLGVTSARIQAAADAFHACSEPADAGPS